MTRASAYRHTRPSIKGLPSFLVRAPLPLYAPTPSADPRPRRRQPPADADGSNLSARAWLQPHTQGAFSAGHHMRTVTVSASPVVNTRRSIQCFALLAVDTRRSFALSSQSRRTYNWICHFSSRDRAVQHNRHHPCWKAAYFLPCTRPPDVFALAQSSAQANQLRPLSSLCVRCHAFWISNDAWRARSC